MYKEGKKPSVSTIFFLPVYVAYFPDFPRLQTSFLFTFEEETEERNKDIEHHGCEVSEGKRAYALVVVGRVGWHRGCIYWEYSAERGMRKGGKFDEKKERNSKEINAKSAQIKAKGVREE
jgi:hypothetical protein